MRLAGIIDNDLNSGEGVCVSIFFQGCPFHCKGCHNPETWSIDGGYDVNFNDFSNQIEELLVKNGIQRNLSILGGEPLYRYNKIAVALLLNRIRQKYPNIKIFLWTGYLYEDLLKNDVIHHQILPKIDVLIDGQYMEEERDVTLKFRGSRNQRVIDVQKSLQGKEVKLYTT